MSDPFPPLGWSPQPESWPYWMPQAFMGLLPPLPTSPSPAPKQLEDPWSELSTSQSLERLGVPAATAPQPSELWDRSTPSWLRSAIAPSGGILGSFPPANNLGTEKPPAWSLAPAVSSGGLLAQLAQPSDPAEQRAPAWPAPPFDASLGSAWAPAAPIAHLASTHIWPFAPLRRSPSAAPFPGNSFYLSQVPPAPDWESVPADATTGITQSVGETPGLPSWGAAVPGSSPENSPPDEAALADEARRVAGLRLGRRERPSVLARSSPPSPETEAAAGDPGLRERARLNFLNSYYRGTLFGAGRLAGLAQLAATPDEEGISPDLKRVRDDLRQEYRQITADLARYDRMRSFGSAGELGAAALGQLGGAVLSPESWLGLNAKGATWLWRSGKAALQQGAITGTADPIVQALNIRAGVQEQYDPARTGLAVGAGALLGAGGRLGSESLSQQLSSKESVLSNLYRWTERTLRVLDPSNSELRRTNTAIWIPTTEDLARLNNEITRIKEERKNLKHLETHHVAAQEFKSDFKRLDIEPEDYLMFMHVEDHRLKPGGVHTGPNNWNGQLRRFFNNKGDWTEQEALEQLNKMMGGIPPWRAP